VVDISRERRSIEHVTECYPVPQDTVICSHAKFEINT
jgi:hypothetical protein